MCKCPIFFIGLDWGDSSSSASHAASRRHLNIDEDGNENDDDHPIGLGLSHAAFNDQCTGSPNALGTRGAVISDTAHGAVRH